MGTSKTYTIEFTYDELQVLDEMVQDRQLGYRYEGVGDSLLFKVADAANDATTEKMGKEGKLWSQRKK